MEANKIYTGEGSAIDNYLNPSEKEQIKSNAVVWGAFDKSNPKHKKILAILREAKWTVPSDKHPSGKVADMLRLGEFLQTDKSPVKKPLQKMTPQETEKIIKALDGIAVGTWKPKPRKS